MKEEKVGMTPKKILTIAVLSLALAIIIIDSSVLNVSISKLITDLHTDIKTIDWVISVYSLVLGALTITGGRLGDLLGRKKMFVLGAIIFAIGSLIASFSTNVNMLLFGWSIIEGIGAALMMPATASLLIASFKDQERAIAFGIWGGIAGASAALGPIIGGYLTTNVSWHWAFRINVFVVIALVIGSIVIKESIDRKEKKELDILGVLLSSSSLFLLVYGIIESSTYGWITAKVPYEIFGHTYGLWGYSIVVFTLVAGLLLMGAFMLWENYVEKKGETPLVSLKLFPNKAFTSGVITTAIMSLGQTGLIFAVPIFLQAVRHLNSFDTGVALLPMSLALLVFAPLSAVLVKKISAKNLVIIGLIITGIASVVLYYSLNVDTTAMTLIPGLFIYGAGMGLVMSQINNITLSAVDVYQAGEASGVNTTMRQVGATLGSAIVGAIFLSSFTTTFVNGINESKVIPEIAKQPIVKVVQDSGSELEFNSVNNNPQLARNPALANEMVKLTNESTVKGNMDALLVTTG
ncbi:MAG TPA: MFS transporter, partial [Candidatus Dojkabacteria bacterium]|nr:MFS transporter [Candidatus Dojkabacteria bacterium]